MKRKVKYMRLVNTNVDGLIPKQQELEDSIKDSNPEIESLTETKRMNLQ